jgi:hypothetical protein
VLGGASLPGTVGRGSFDMDGVCDFCCWCRCMSMIEKVSLFLCKFVSVEKGEFLKRGLAL